MSATCHPGQNSTYAFAGAPVLLKPEEPGDLFPASQGTVTLTSNKDGGSDNMTVIAWTPALIVALIPLSNPGSGEDGETFSVSIQGVGSANPVVVAGPAGGYPLPPTHTPDERANEAEALTSQS
ncbi:MAG: hypothetical protein ACRD1T_16100 [Acidimicrobiia bacterium]